MRFGWEVSRWKIKKKITNRYLADEKIFITNCKYNVQLLTDIGYVVPWVIEVIEKASRRWPVYVYKNIYFNPDSFARYIGNNTAEFPVQGALIVIVFYDQIKSNNIMMVFNI